MTTKKDFFLRLPLNKSVISMFKNMILWWICQFLCEFPRILADFFATRIRVRITGLWVYLCNSISMVCITYTTSRIFSSGSKGVGSSLSIPPSKCPCPILESVWWIINSFKILFKIFFTSYSVPLIVFRFTMPLLIEGWADMCVKLSYLLLVRNSIWRTRYILLDSDLQPCFISSPALY